MAVEARRRIRRDQIGQDSTAFWHLCAKAGAAATKAAQSAAAAIRSLLIMSSLRSFLSDFAPVTGFLCCYLSSQTIDRSWLMK